VVAFALLVMAVCQIGICTGGLNATLGQLDFRTFYSAGYMVRSGEASHLYDVESEKRVQNTVVSPRVTALPFFNPAYAAVLFFPLSYFSYRVAYFVFFGLNLMLVWLAAVVLRPYMPAIAALWKPLPILIFLCYFPVGIALREGQMSLIVLLLYCACFVALQNGWPFVAGIFLALALIKFQIALPVALLFLVWRCWGFVAGFSSGAIALALLSLCVTGASGLEVYGHSLLSSRSIAVTARSLFEIVPTHMPNLYGLFYSISGGADWEQVVTMACSLLVLGWAMFQRPSLPLALLVGMLVSYHFYQYDLSLLLLPIGLTLNQAVLRIASDSDESRQLKSTSPTVGRMVTAIFVCCVLLASPLYMFLMMTERVYLLACPVAALLFYLPPTGDSSESIHTA
jgi:hypothetical protein